MNHGDGFGSRAKAKSPEISEEEHRAKVKSVRCKQIPLYHCVDWCGLLCVYIHSDGPETRPEYELPEFESRELSDKRWQWHLQKKVNIGYKKLTPVDWVDQSGDHSHFHTLHSHIFLPFTTIPAPKFITDRISYVLCIHFVLFSAYFMDVNEMN